MSNCPSRSYQLDPAEAITICAKIEQQSGIHIDPTQPTGTAETHGVTITWKITGDAITIGIPERPWIISCDHIYNELDSLFGK